MSSKGKGQSSYAKMQRCFLVLAETVYFSLAVKKLSFNVKKNWFDAKSDA
jgi:hypothetical protein